MSSRGEFLGSNSVQNCLRILGRHSGYLSAVQFLCAALVGGQAIGGLAMNGFLLAERYAHVGIWRDVIFSFHVSLILLC